MSKREKSLQKEFPVKKTFSVTLAILFLLVFSATLITYLPFYPSFVPRNFVHGLDNFFAQLPLVPKTSKQILTRALLENQNLQNYSLKTSISVQTEKGEKIAVANLNGEIKDAALFTSSYKAVFKGGFVPFDEGVINLQEENNNFYFQVSKPPISPFVDLTKTQSNWYKVNLDQFQKNLGAETLDDYKILSDMKSFFEKVREKFEDNFPKNYKIEKLGNENFYHFIFRFSASESKDILPSTEIKETDVWVEKDNFVLSRTLVKGTTNVISLGKGSAPLSFQIDYSINQDHINFPSVQKATELNDPITFWTFLNGKQNDKSSETLLQAATSSADYSANFLTVERLLKVSFLLGKAI